MQNKWEHVSERAFDIVMDHLHTLNDATPKIKCQGRNGVDPGLIFGLQSKLFLSEPEAQVTHDEVETLTLGTRGIVEKHQHHHHTSNEVVTTHEHNVEPVKKDKLLNAMQVLPRDTIWRVKGFVKLEEGGWHILNWAFGRYELQICSEEPSHPDIIWMTVMGSRGDVRRGVAKFVSMLFP